jgi:hypothetical protein
MLTVSLATVIQELAGTGLKEFCLKVGNNLTRCPCTEAVIRDRSSRPKRKRKSTCSGNSRSTLLVLQIEFYQATRGARYTSSE